MSDQEEQSDDTQNTVDSTEESDDAFDTVNIPLPSEDAEESDADEEHVQELEQFNEDQEGEQFNEDQEREQFNEDQEREQFDEDQELEQFDEDQELEQFNEDHEIPEEETYYSISSPESKDEEQPREEIAYPPEASHTLEPDEMLFEKQPAKQIPSDDNLAFLNQIKAIKQSLQTSVKEASATVKVVLIPVGQEIIMPFKVDTAFRYLKNHFSRMLDIPSYALQLTYEGVILRNNETLVQHGVNPQDIVQVEILSLHPDVYPIKKVILSQDASQIITTTVQTGINQYQEIAVEIIRSDFHKPFLGGFRHKITGIEYHNAGTQTVPKKIPEKCNRFSRDTQTVFQRKKLQQTTNTTSTQMTKIGVYVSNMTDKLLEPGQYFSAAEYHAQRLEAVIIIQKYYRRWHAKVFVEDLRRQRNLRLEWEAEEERRKIREKEEWMQLDYYRRHNPKTNEDFELLYNALELWWQEELAAINQHFTGAERKACLCELLEKETQIIASIGRHRCIARMARQEAEIQAFLDKCSATKTWRTADGKVIEMDTQFTIRARELQNIYKCIMLKNLSQDERLDILLTLKHTVKEHECKLTQEILELIDREVDLMMRGVKPHNLEGLRKRITTLFLHYIKTPLFNPEVARHLKVPQDPLKFCRKIYFCHGCQLYLPSTEFSVSSTSERIYRCRHCINLENETQKRESFLKYKCLLQRLYYSEANYEDDSRIAFLMQLQDIQYLVENIWASQSVLSAWNNLNDLVMARWDKSVEWSPWNCILLTKDEEPAHLRLMSIEEGYGRLFIHKIRHKHILARNYFCQIPVLASFILKDEEVGEIRKKYSIDTTPKIIEPRGSCH